jgi:hypothetical protein
VSKGIPHDLADLFPFVWIEGTGVCIPIRNSEVLLAGVHKSPSHAWNVADITEPLWFGHKSLLAGDLNAKHLFRNSVVYNPTGAKLLILLNKNEFKISAPKRHTHYSPAGNDTCLILLCIRL